MYKINGQQYALESGDKITIVRDGGGMIKVTLKVESGDTGAPAPLVSEANRILSLKGIDTVIIEATDE